MIATPIILLLARDAQDRKRYARWLINRTFLCFIYFMKCVGVLTWTTENLSKLRQKSILVLANHPTLIDVVFLVAYIPHADCIVKGRLLANPAMRGFLKLTDFISNETGPELITHAAQSIQGGSALIVFPEGTRSVPGGELKFQRGAANIALASDARIVPVVIRCEPITLSKSHRWYHIPHKPIHYLLAVRDEFDISPYRTMPRTTAARRLTQDLEQYFSREIKP